MLEPRSLSLTSGRSAALALLLASGLAACSTRMPDPATAPAEPHAASTTFEVLAWERASFERAAAEDKLILIQVVAGWCHWCHVMDEETLADPRVAALLAEHFVVIRVDADARPDLAERYRAWGWPASAFLSPSAEPALNLRGYRAPEVFAELLRELVAEHQRGALRRFDPSSPPDASPTGSADERLLAARELARAQLDGFFDPDGLGWGATQKYPWPDPIDYAFVRARLHGESDRGESDRGESDWQDRALATLAAEEALIDPVDGGMYQYSVRGVWDRPHFEKIAAVQAGAIETYAHAARITGDPRWLGPANAVARYVLGPLQAPDGGFYASQDADLRRADGTSVAGADYYGLDADGRRALGSPRIDTHVYADLDGLLIHALVELHRAWGDAESLAAAVRAGERLLATHRDPRGGFTHAPLADAPPGERRFYLADQANPGWAFVALHHVTGDPRWRDAAVEVAEFMLAELVAPGGGFYAHDEDPAAVGVFAQRRVPLPENALAAQFLVELHGIVDGDGSVASPWLEHARATLLAIADANEIAARGKVVGRYLIALDLALSTRFDLTVVAAPGDPKGDALWNAALTWWEPRATLERSAPGQRYPDLGRAAAYLCSDSACSKPIDDPARFAALADAFTRPEP